MNLETSDIWLMVDGRPARVLLVENDGEHDFLDYARPGGAQHFIRLGGRSGLGSPRLTDLRPCALCAQPLNSRDCPLSVETAGDRCLLCSATREIERFGAVVAR